MWYKIAKNIFLYKIADWDPSGLIKELKKSKVPQTIINFVLSEKYDIPTKSKKWFGLKLKDLLQDYTSEEEQYEKLKSMLNQIILVRDWAKAMSKKKGFQLFEYKTFEDALEAAIKWHEELSDSDKGHPLLYTQPNLNAFQVGNGYKMVRVCYEDLENEGNLMGHCVGSGIYHSDVKNGKVQIWSLRDKNNFPHATIELRKTNGQTGKFTVSQICGKENKPIIEKYRPYIRKWLIEKRDEGVKVSKDMMMSVEPSEKIIEKIKRNPESIYSLIEYIDEKYRSAFIVQQIIQQDSELFLNLLSYIVEEDMPYLTTQLIQTNKYKLIKNQGVRAHLIMKLYKTILNHHLSNNLKEEIEDYIVQDIMSGNIAYENWNQTIIPTLLTNLKERESSNLKYFLKFLEHSDIIPYRKYAINFILRTTDPETGEQYSQTEEGIQYAAEHLSRENIPDIINDIIKIYLDELYLPEEIIKVLPHILVNIKNFLTEALSSGKYDINYYTYNFGNLCNFIAFLVPQFLPKLIEIVIPYLFFGSDALLNALQRVKLYYPDIYKETIKIIAKGKRDNLSFYDRSIMQDIKFAEEEINASQGEQEGGPQDNSQDESQDEPQDKS